MKIKMKRICSFVLAFVLLISNSLSNVQAAEQVTYQSNSYSVDGIVAYSYNGQSISGDGYVKAEMTDNSQLAKALYYSYGSLGYAKSYAEIDKVYVQFGASCDTDKLAISEMVLTNLKNGSSNDMTSAFVSAIGGLPDYNADVFIPYYIYNAAREIVGYTSTSNEAYQTPGNTIVKEETTEDEEDEPSSEAVINKPDDESDLSEEEFNFELFNSGITEDEALLQNGADVVTIDSVHTIKVNGEAASYYKYNGGTLGFCFHHKKGTCAPGSTAHIWHESSTSFPAVVPQNENDRKNVAVAVYENLNGSLWNPDSTNCFDSIIACSILAGHGGASVSSNNERAQAKASEVRSHAESYYLMDSSQAINPKFTNTGKTITKYVKNTTYIVSESMQLNDAQDYLFQSTSVLPNGVYCAVSNTAIGDTPKATSIDFEPGDTVKVNGGQYITLYFDTGEITYKNINNYSMQFTCTKSGIAPAWIIPDVGDTQPVCYVDKTEVKSVSLKVGTWDTSGSFSFLKVGIKGVTVAGAKYRLKKSDNSNASFHITSGTSVTMSNDLVTNADGYLTYTFTKPSSVTIDQIKEKYVCTTSGTSVTVTFTPSKPMDLNKGNYKISEVSAPDGYQVDPACSLSDGKAHTFTISDDKDPVIVKCKESGYCKATFIKKASNNLITGCSNYTLNGAEYTFKKADGSAAKMYIGFAGGNETVTVDKFVTDTNGNMTFTVASSSLGSGASLTTLQKTYSVVKSGSNYVFTFTEDNPIYVEPGAYVLKETKAPQGYGICDICSSTGHSLNLSDPDKLYKYTCKEPQKLDPVDIEVQKRDLETGKINPLGTEQLDGAIFGVYYYDAELTKTAALSATPKAKWYFKTVNGKWNFKYDNPYNDSTYQSSAFYRDENGDRGIPVGTVLVKEEVPPAGFDNTSDVDTATKAIKINGTIDNSDNDSIMYQIKIDSNGDIHRYLDGSSTTEVGSVSGTITYTFKDPTHRGDLSFSKTDLDGQPMAYVPFLLKCVETGESHVVVTDENGYFSTKNGAVMTVDGASATYNHTTRTNQNDNYTVQTINGLKPTGTWFYGYTDNQDASEIDNSQGALPAGNYTLIEIASNKNYGKQLIKEGDVVFHIENDGEEVQKVVTNYDSPSFETESKDTLSMGHTSQAAADVHVTDTATYQYLRYGEHYTFKGILVAREDFTTAKGVKYKAGDLIKDDFGDYITTTKSFTTQGAPGVDDKYPTASGTVDLEYNFDATTLQNAKGVWFTYLCEGIDNTPLVIVDGQVDKDQSNVLHFLLNEETMDILFVEDTSLTNASEFIDFVGITTDAFTETYEKNVDQASEHTVIKDKVFLSNLIQDADYTLVSKLVDKDGNPVLGADGTQVTTTTPFKYRKDSETGGMELVVAFPAFNSIPYAGSHVVVTQEVVWNNSVIMSDNSLTNSRETVYFLKIQTKASGEEGNKQIPLTGTVKIIDEVSYQGLMPNKEYTVTGTLHYIDKDGKEKTILYKDGSEVTASQTFTAQDTDGTLEMEFVFNVNDIQGPFPSKTVVFEDFYEDGILLGTHADIKDKNQTVYFSSLSTSLREDGTDTQFLDTFEKEVTLVDTVTYHELIKDQTYTVVGKLINKNTGKVLTAGGKEITASKTFKAADSEGTVDVTFTFDGKTAKDLIGEDGAVAQIVAYEYLYSEIPEGTTPASVDEKTLANHYKGIKLWSMHNDISDVEQTITSASGKTTLTDAKSGSKYVTLKKTITLNDKVTFKNLIVGKTYKVTGTLYTTKDYASKKALSMAEKDANGKTAYPVLNKAGEKITNTVYFVPKSPDGYVMVPFTFEREVAETHNVMVAFEDVSYENEDETFNVFTHADITDSDQTVVVPSLHTTALSADNKEHMAGTYKVAKIIDTVKYYNLYKGQKYKLEGILMDQSTGEAVSVNDNPVTASVEFEPNGKERTLSNGDVLVSGKQNVDFIFDSTLVAGKNVVVFEKLYAMIDGNWKEITSHEDLDDNGQTVRFTDLHTTASGKDTKAHKLKPAKDITIVDTVEYFNLKPGKEYTIRGMLMLKPQGNENVSIFDKLTGNIEKDGDRSYKLAKICGVYDEKNGTYVDQYGRICYPLIADGKVVTSEVTFVADKPSGTVNVEFTLNALDLAGKDVVVFENLYNENVQVGIHADITDEGQTITFIPDNPKTDDSFPLIPLLGGAGLLLLGIFAVIFIKRKRSKKA